MKKLNCSNCGEEFERNRFRKSKTDTYYCSSQCQQAHSKLLQEDVLSKFRVLYNDIVKSSKRRGISVTIGLEDIADLWEHQKHRCKLTGVELFFGDTAEDRRRGKTTASIDRIVSSNGYHADNIQFVHKNINLMKFYLHEDVFIDWCRKVASHTADRELDYPATPCDNPVVDDDTVPF